MSSSSVSLSTTSRTLLLLSIHTLLEEENRGRESSRDSGFEATRKCTSYGGHWKTRDRREAENRPKSSNVIQQQRWQYIQQLSYASKITFAQPEYFSGISLCIPRHFCMCVPCESKARYMFHIRASLQDGLALFASQSFIPVDSLCLWILCALCQFCSSRAYGI